MKLDADQLRRLAGWIAATREDEIDCDELLARVPALLERRAAGGDDVEQDVALLQHLRVCPECLEEIEALLEARAGGE